MSMRPARREGTRLVSDNSGDDARESFALHESQDALSGQRDPTAYIEETVEARCLVERTASRRRLGATPSQSHGTEPFQRTGRRQSCVVLIWWIDGGETLTGSAVCPAHLPREAARAGRPSRNGSDLARAWRDDDSIHRPDRSPTSSGHVRRAVGTPIVRISPSGKQDDFEPRAPRAGHEGARRVQSTGPARHPHTGRRSGDQSLRKCDERFRAPHAQGYSAPDGRPVARGTDSMRPQPRARHRASKTSGIRGERQVLEKIATRTVRPRVCPQGLKVPNSHGIPAACADSLFARPRVTGRRVRNWRAPRR